MPSKELIEKVASHFEFPDKETTLVTAENILNEILAALQEPPSQAMWDAFHKAYNAHWTDMFSNDVDANFDGFQAALAASALGEQSE